MKKFFCVAIITILAISVQAQVQRRPYERVHAAKVAYITDRIQLTRNQSEHFWPVYNDFESDRMTLRKKYFNLDKGANADKGNWKNNNDEHHFQDRNDNDTRQSIEDNLDYQQEELDLKRKYSNEFLKIISAQQLALLYKSEREFRQLLMQRLKEHRGHSGHGDGNWR